MMGQRQFETKLYYQLSLDRLVPPDHLLRRLAAAVDFSFVRSLCQPFYSHTRQPSVDPGVIFKMRSWDTSTESPPKGGLRRRLVCIWLTAGSWATTATGDAGPQRSLQGARQAGQ
jgi:hypothetical protein